MKGPLNLLPVFALDSETTWDDLENDFSASVEYQNARGRILPIMLFAPMMEPENPDVWEPLKVLPENLFIVSIERTMDARILNILRHAKSIIGETFHAATSPFLKVNYERPLAEVYAQMDRDDICAFAITRDGKDDPSFFFVRGAEAVRAFAHFLTRVRR